VGKKKDSENPLRCLAGVSYFYFYIDLEIKFLQC